MAPSIRRFSAHPGDGTEELLSAPKEMASILGELSVTVISGAGLQVRSSSSLPHDPLCLLSSLAYHEGSYRDLVRIRHSLLAIPTAHRTKRCKWWH